MLSSKFSYKGTSMKEIVQVVENMSKDIDKLVKHYRVIDPHKERQMELLANIIDWNKGYLNIVSLDTISRMVESIANGEQTSDNIRLVLGKIGLKVNWSN